MRAGREQERMLWGTAASDSQGGREASSVETSHSLNQRSFSSQAPPFFPEVILILIMIMNSRCVLRAWYAVALEEMLTGTRRFPSAFQFSIFSDFVATKDWSRRSQAGATVKWTAT